MTERTTAPKRTPAGKNAGRSRSARARDRLSAAPKPRVADFGRETAKVFDDTLLRSVPMYAETQRMVGNLVTDFAADRSNIHDLGCSTGTPFLDIDRILPEERDVRFVGLESSPQTLQRELLESVLIRYRFEESRKSQKRTRFRTVDVFARSLHRPGASAVV